MFKNRYFLLGLGLGLILGAVLLQLMLMSDAQKMKLGAIDKLGDTAKTYTQEEVDKLVNEAVTNAVSDAKNQQTGGVNAPDRTAANGGKAPGDGGKAQTGGKEGPAAQTAADQPSSRGGASEDVKLKIVRIKQGATSEEVAALLKDEGIIKDDKAFVKLMSDSATRIQAGKFLFVNAPSPEKVKEIITGTPFAS